MQMTVFREREGIARGSDVLGEQAVTNIRQICLQDRAVDWQIIQPAQRLGCIGHAILLHQPPRALRHEQDGRDDDHGEEALERDWEAPVHAVVFDVVEAELEPCAQRYAADSEPALQEH